MKNKILVMAFATILTASLFSIVTLRANEQAISVSVDGQSVSFENQEPVIVDGRTLVPVRGVFEVLGFDVGWDGNAQQVTLTSDRYVVILTIGNTVFTTNGTRHNLDVPAQIISGSTMLPIRAVVESVGYSLDWDEATRTVIINSISTSTQPPSTYTGFEHNVTRVYRFNYTEAVAWFEQDLEERFNNRVFQDVTFEQWYEAFASTRQKTLEVLARGNHYLYVEFFPQYTAAVAPIGTEAQQGRVIEMFQFVIRTADGVEVPIQW